MPRIEGRPGEKMPPMDLEKLKKDLQEIDPQVKALDRVMKHAVLLFLISCIG